MDLALICATHVSIGLLTVRAGNTSKHGAADFLSAVP